MSQTRTTGTLGEVADWASQCEGRTKMRGPRPGDHLGASASIARSSGSDSESTFTGRMQT
jgi:hypothetical protein